MNKYRKKYRKHDLHKPLDASRIALVDLNEGRIMQQEDCALFGKCNRCGACCRGPGVPYPHRKLNQCRQLVITGANPDGSSIFKCKIYPIRPVGCALWPEPFDDMPDTCGYYWIKGEAKEDL
jgi:hypothetical protein